MALYDHRVFKAGNNWWVAQVHGGTGAGWGSDRPRITDERVMFRCLTNEVPGRTASIPAGLLNRMSHGSIVDLLGRSEESNHGLPMHPYNAPGPEDFSENAIYTDAEGLQWAVTKSTVILHHEGTAQTVVSRRLICLDDTALHRDIVTQSFDTHDERGSTISEEIVAAIKASYERWPSHTFGREEST